MTTPERGTSPKPHQPTRHREIGPMGTWARVLVGILLLALGVVGGKVIVVGGYVRTGFQPVSLALGLLAFPAIVIAWQWIRARRAPSRLLATGPLATALNMLVFFALVLTPFYAPPLSFTSPAALAFYGASMVLAAVRGYCGCEVLAVSNWVLHRNDEVGCLVFSPLDQLERRLRASR
jgi:hypothetical protein